MDEQNLNRKNSTTIKEIQEQMLEQVKNLIPKAPLDLKQKEMIDKALICKNRQIRFIQHVENLLRSYNLQLEIKDDVAYFLHCFPGLKG